MGLFLISIILSERIKKLTIQVVHYSPLLCAYKFEASPMENNLIAVVEASKFVLIFNRLERALSLDFIALIFEFHSLFPAN